jgi:hypothetical protein
MSGIDVVVKVVGSVDRMTEGRVDWSRKEACLRVSDGKNRAVRLGFDKGRLCICSFLHSFPPLSSFSFPPCLAQIQSFESLIHFARAWTIWNTQYVPLSKLTNVNLRPFLPFSWLTHGRDAFLSDHRSTVLWYFVKRVRRWFVVGRLYASGIDGSIW